jgi:hypothetical protein
MTGNKDDGPADAVASGGAKFVLEPKEVVSIYRASIRYRHVYSSTAPKRAMIII